MSPLQARIIAIRQKLIELDSWIYDEFEDDLQADELIDMAEMVQSAFDDFADKVKEFKEVKKND